MAFYLSSNQLMATGNPFPATGLYHYRQRPNGSFSRRLLDAKGEVKPPLTIVEVNLSPNPQVNPYGWMEVPATDPAEYISFLPYSSNDTAVIHPFPLTQTNGDYFLADTVYEEDLYLALSLRYALGYQMMDEWAHDAQQPMPDNLRNNLIVFWESIAKVANRGISRFTDSLIPPDDPSVEFRIPDWAFHLIRVIAEGFIDGHARRFENQFGKPKSGKYRVNSPIVWERVINAIEQNVTWPQVRDDPTNVNLTDLERNTILEMVFFNGAIPNWFQGDFLEIITPGITDQQEIAFWLVHVPHWYGDLCQVVTEFGLRPPEAGTVANKPNKHDWDMFEEVIMGGWPTEEGTSAWDLLLYLFALFSIEVAEESEFNPRNFIVGRIFERVRAKAAANDC